MININRVICDYIKENWFEGPIRKVAIEHDIDEKTARRIISDDSYSMTIETLEKMCRSREITLAEFFGKIKR